MNPDAVRQHAALNRWQTLLLVGFSLALAGLAGYVLFGEPGAWLALAATLVMLALQPVAPASLTLSLYRARPIPPAEAPGLWRILETLAARAGLPSVPVPYYVPSRVANAFAVGDRRHSAIALTDGLLAGLGARELAGVLAHETAHIANGDLRVMGLADHVSRLTGAFATGGLLMILLLLPDLLDGQLEVRWGGLLLLTVSPHLALLTQLGLSRVREFDADLTAARLTGDPAGLASALARLEGAARGWRGWMFPGWGNPDPSWLRSHPATAERIGRLLDLSVPTYTGDEWREEPDRAESRRRPVTRLTLRDPRWHYPGIWR